MATRPKPSAWRYAVCWNRTRVPARCSGRISGRSKSAPASTSLSGHIDLDIAIEGWVERFLDRPGIEAVALGHRAAARSYQLHHLEHRDPGDRLLIATAIEL